MQFFLLDIEFGEEGQQREFTKFPSLTSQNGNVHQNFGMDRVLLSWYILSERHN